MEIILAAVIVGGTGLLLGLFLGLAGKKFAVEIDEKEQQVREQLPGNNCGGCGYAGCANLAAAIAKGEAPVNACPVGGEKYYLNKETAEMAQKLFENKDLRVLFDAAKDATPEDLKTTYDMLMALKKKERDNNEF